MKCAHRTIYRGLQRSPGEAAAGGSASVAAGALSASELPLVVRTAIEAAASPRLLAIPPAASEAKGTLLSQGAGSSGPTVPRELSRTGKARPHSMQHRDSSSRHLPSKQHLRVKRVAPSLIGRHNSQLGLRRLGVLSSKLRTSQNPHT